MPGHWNCWKAGWWSKITLTNYNAKLDSLDRLLNRLHLKWENCKNMKTSVKLANRVRALEKERSKLLEKLNK